MSSLLERRLAARGQSVVKDDPEGPPPSAVLHILDNALSSRDPAAVPTMTPSACAAAQ